jgi:glyoxylase-like metal-dependent hydrolase (beta-lactamase superfamily II)
MDVYGDGNLTVKRFGPLGSFANNAYIIADEASGEALVVDMPSGSQEVIAAAKDLNVRGIILTHTHHDHWMDYDLVKAALGAPVICHPAEQIMPAEQIDEPLADGATLAAGDIRVRALHTPGHTPGSTCLLTGKFLFSGDTLFPGGPGRTNSPADLQQSIQSITSVLFALPDETEVLPGHGEGTTIGEAKKEYAAFAAREHPADLCGDVTWAES